MEEKVIEDLKDKVIKLSNITFKGNSIKNSRAVYDRYNCFLTNLVYGEDEDGNTVFVCSQETRKKMMYYVGLEYEDYYIEYKLETDHGVVLAYRSDCSRVEELASILSGVAKD